MGADRIALDDEFEDVTDEFEDVPDEFEDVNLPEKQSGTERSKAIKEYVTAPEKTPEQIRAMSTKEKFEYAEQLDREFRYRSSKGFTKGAASGATLGASEYIPALAPEEDDILYGAGELTGSIAPISKILKYVGQPIAKQIFKSNAGKKALEFGLTSMGLTGATYEGAKHAIQEGEAPSPEVLIKGAADWAALDGAFQAVGQTVKPFLDKLSKASNGDYKQTLGLTDEITNKLAQENINPETNPDQFTQRAQEILEDLSPKSKERKLPDLIIEKVPESKIEIKPAKMESRVSKEVKTEIPKPIIETTGEGASERHEYAKTSVQNVIDGVNDFIDIAKTPVQSFKRTTAAMDQAVFNFLAPLEKLETGLSASEKVSSKIKLAQSVNSEINNVLENGIFSNMSGQFEHEGLKGAYGDLQWKKFTKDLNVPQEFSLQELDNYRTSKIALKRQKEGRKTGIDTFEAQSDIETLKEKYEVVDARIREFQKNIINEYGKDLLGEELTKKFNDNYYSPLYRVMDSGTDSILASGSLEPKTPFYKFKGSKRKIIPPSESDPYNASMLISNARKNDAVLEYMKGVVEGRFPGKIKVGKNKSIPDDILESLGIDEDLEPIAETLYNQTRQGSFTPEENTIRGWVNGKPVDISVPEEIFNVFQSSGPQQIGPFAKFMSKINQVFSRGISLEPRKFGSIVSRDALSSLVYSKTGSNPISIFEALADIHGNKQIYKQFKAMGGDVYASRLATRIDRANKVTDLITPGQEGKMIPFEKMFDFFKKYPQVLSDISMAVPLAEYKRALAVYGDSAEGRIAAAMEARRVTYDPTRKGGSKMIRGIGNFVPFWNVSLQDMSMLGKNLKNKETWIKGFTGITLPTLALSMYNEDNPDYQALNPVDKAAFWHIYSGENHYRIPIPWLLGTTFKVLAEAFYDTVRSLSDQGNERAKESWAGLYHNFVQNISGTLPPLLQNYIEQATGKSPGSPVGALLGVESKSPEIVPKRLQDLPPHLQYTSKTSQAAKYFGNLWNVSPIKLERGIKNFGGLVAADVLALTDEIAYWSGLAEDKRPEQGLKNYLLLGNFVGESTPSNTKYQSEFYKMLHEKVIQNKARKIIPGYGDASLDSVDLVAYNKEISSKLKFMRDLEDDSSLSPKEKRDKMLNVQKDINKLYKQATDKVKYYRNKSK